MVKRRPETTTLANTIMNSESEDELTSQCREVQQEWGSTSETNQRLDEDDEANRENTNDEESNHLPESEIHAIAVYQWQLQQESNIAIDGLQLAPPANGDLAESTTVPGANLTNAQQE